MWVEFVFGIVLWFDLPLLQNQLFEFSIRPGMVDEEKCGCATSKTLFTQLPD